MPATPVGQIPYPQGTDPPVIPSDMKALASGTDGWVSSLDAALQTRLGAVTSRLSAVSTRLTAVKAATTVANTNMDSGDTAIASGQTAVNNVLSRLATQDTTAAALQTRYTNDNNELDQFRNFTPLGSSGALSFINSVSNDSSGNQFWLGAFNFSVNAPAPSWRVTFSIAAQITSNDQTGRAEFRICPAAAPTAVWASFVTRSFLGRQGNSNLVPISMSATVNAGNLRNVPVQIAVGVQGTPGYPISAFIQGATIQYLQSGGY